MGSVRGHLLVRRKRDSMFMLDGKMTDRMVEGDGAHARGRRQRRAVVLYEAGLSARSVARQIRQEQGTVLSPQTVTFEQHKRSWQGSGRPEDRRGRGPVTDERSISPTILPDHDYE